VARPHMIGEPASGRSAHDVDAAFRESRTTALIAVNLNTFWSIAVVLLSFAFWDAYADAARWRTAFIFRAIGAVIVIGTGVFQKLPGRSHWLPLFAKIRLVIALVVSAIAASMLERGYGFGVAGLVVIILTGTYIAIDSRDLLRLNMLIVLALTPVIVFVPLPPFEKIGTGVFVLLALAASTLLGRVIEVSNRRAYALELELIRDARTDSLTGLDNRRAMLERGRVELKRSSRSGVPVSVILCDLDHFKNINDKYGHEAGDAALTRSAMVLRRALRESDALGRWGGEEFMAILPGTNAQGAAEVAERMRLSIAVTKFDGLSEGTTISIGVASSEQFEDPGMEWDLLIKEADQRLYRAKREGRNRVVSASR
ncbi:MAG TPA: GGDEF domain-containing protein, partial [Vicinamibacterales bacterium]|nr:GGDEF domain-containing protein [Vicinamibacterales bacterium]